ncbi:translation initiation factor IF-3 [Candidatus Peribacteria bacterium]|nr:translation initiation factor IF-3 [Candidatus Peribacteria bacterium]
MILALSQSLTLSVECFCFHSLSPLRQRHHSNRPVKQLERRPRINEQITVPEVMLVADDGATRTLTTKAALEEARALGYDLIEVSPKAVPPVVKIGEFGHFLYQLQKKERKQRSHSKQVEVKMLRIGYRTEKHDIDRLVGRAREFFEERHLVKFNMRLRGRELGNKEYGINKLKGIVEALKDVGDVEQEIKRQGDQFTVILKPKR